LKQVVTSLKDGALRVADVPAPLARPGHVVIANARSLISAGTEKMAMDLARKSLLGKARERPDQVRRVREKIRQEGLLATIRAVRSRLDEPTGLGYSSAGVVIACGAGVQEYRVGDRVASNGPHAGVVCVPRHLCARVPDAVSFDEAAFGVLGAIALQGVRLARVSLGDVAFVVGLGLLGQITVGLLRAAGARVIGTDPDASRCELARTFGAEAAWPGLDGDAVRERTLGRGADAVLVAAATESSGPVSLAGDAVRAKGRVVVVGVVGMELPRRPYYFKEAEFVVSCSYGPGRYDPDYEERGHDYPAAHVRWTEQRNLQAVLDLMGERRLDVRPLVTHRFPIDRAEDAYRMIEEGTERYLGILLEHPDAPEATPSRTVERTGAAPKTGGVGVGFVGSGAFARAVLLPALAAVPDVRLRAVASAGGLSAVHAADRHGFEVATTDADAVLGDPAVDVVFVATRHDDHAGLVVRALGAGKHVFVEKPLALTLEQIDEVERALEASGRLLLVGFNRRFAPAAREVLQAFRDSSAPRTVHVRFNAGAIPAEHRIQVEDVGGGRIVGEACHAVDLATALAGSPPVRVFAEGIGGPNAPSVTDDQAFLLLRHANGSVSSISYAAGGDRALPKERVEVFGGGVAAVIDDWREVTVVRGGRARRRKALSQDKGHREEVAAFVRAVAEGGSSPIPWSDLRAVSRASVLAVRSLREGFPFDV
jgi:predicted dehydrogenase/threonine dehydrogenase-like Zn-dependent dehydrogenase